MNEWLYFGCYRRPGHYLFGEGMRQLGYDRKLEKLTHFDGKLPPQDSGEPYIATVSRLEGWGLTALAFWDYSVDARGGCNSIVFAPSLDIEPQTLLTEAAASFPQVWARFPTPVRLAAKTA
jgi:hypothetical protein